MPRDCNICNGNIAGFATPLLKGEDPVRSAI